MGDTGEKTERATPKKRRDERRKGHVMMSKDVIAVATLFGGVAMLRLVFGWMVDGMSFVFARCFALIGGMADIEEMGGELWLDSIVATARSVGPILLVVCFMAVAATFAQTRFLVTSELLKPKFNKINPVNGFKNLFSLNSLIEVLKNTLKISILLFLIYTCLLDMMEVAEKLIYAELYGACVYLLEAIFSMLLKISAAFLVIAAADYGYQWWEFERQMKMTKQEVKEEYKQTEGDPQIKSRIKQVQRQMAQSRMMQQVPQADVVIRNPTHVAVALRYHPGQDAAPLVLAMGEDHLALRIVAKAEEHQITVIENVPLARALYAQSDLNQPIPPDLYEAVAEVMVYLFKLGKLQSAEQAG